MDSSISLNKFISDTGYCSRREADNLIKEGRVLINDQIAQMGNRYDVGDIVEVDGSIIKPPKKDKLIYIALYKPAGITTTSEAHIPGNIIDFVNRIKFSRWNDANSSRKRCKIYDVTRDFDLVKKKCCCFSN